MNDYATPDNFKPGERWLVKDNEFSRELCEVRCLEWSPSGIRCKFEYVNSGSKNWSDTTHWGGSAPRMGPLTTPGPRQ